MAEKANISPDQWRPALRALWLERQGQWAEAHSVCQEGDPTEGAWVHAYLHRREGDESNAAYWYSRAGRPPCQDSLEREWQQIWEALSTATDAAPAE
jgi:hypothetical protein